MSKMECTLRICTDLQSRRRKYAGCVFMMQPTLSKKQEGRKRRTRIASARSVEFGEGDQVIASLPAWPAR